MKYSDHYILSLYETKCYGIRRPLYKWSFILGNVVPDITRLLTAGHTAEGTRCYVNHTTRYLNNKSSMKGQTPFTAWNLFDWYRFGKAAHYVADRFTSPHAGSCRRRYINRVAYEEALHLRFSEYVSSLLNGMDKGGEIKLNAVVRRYFSKISLDDMYKSFRKEKRNIETDCFYILAASIKYMSEMLKLRYF